jgi:hypothetical protein
VRLVQPVLEGLGQQEEQLKRWMMRLRDHLVHVM